MAVCNGTIINIDTINKWGLNEIRITLASDNGYVAIYEKLAEIIISEKQEVKKGDIIGITGDINLYPTFDYQLLFNKKPINPMKLLEISN